MRKIVVLSFLCFLTLSSCIIQKRYHLKGYQISKINANKKVKISAKNENTTLRSKLVPSKKIQESRKLLSPTVSVEYQSQREDTTKKTHVSLNTILPLVNQTQKKIGTSELGTVKTSLAKDRTQLEKNEFNYSSTPKSLTKQTNLPPKMPFWKQAVIFFSALVVLIGLYVLLVFTEVFAFGN
jgi:hypothetical protein